MTFKTHALPDPSTLAAALRAKRCVTCVVFLPQRTTGVAPSPKTHRDRRFSAWVFAERSRHSTPLKQPFPD